MIASLTGLVAEKSFSDAIIDVHGVGYRVALSLICLARLPAVGQEARLRIRTVVREDALDLYGFLTADEEALFLLLTSVSHVGPRLAINILSGMDVAELCQAIGKGDVVRLTKLHGVGKKTAERVVLELKDKVKLLPGAPGQKSAAGASGPLKGDLVSALLNLGYKEPQAQAAADTVLERVGEDAPFESQFKEALKVLRSA